MKTMKTKGLCKDKACFTYPACTLAETAFHKKCPCHICLVKVMCNEPCSEHSEHRGDSERGRCK